MISPHLQRLVGAYRTFDKMKPPIVFDVFERQFRKNYIQAIDFLVGTNPEDASEAMAFVSLLETTLAWNQYIEDFKITVLWGEFPEYPPSRPWATLRLLLTAIEERLDHVPPEAPGHAALVHLLAHLLPIYFVKARDIHEPVEHLLAMPTLVARACPAPLEYPEAKEPRDARPHNPLRDACRGFRIEDLGPVVFLALIYNPQADMVSASELDAQASRLEDLRVEVGRLPAPSESTP